MEDGFAVRRRVRFALGVLTGIGLAWGLLLAFWPLTMGTGEYHASCGVPVVNAHRDDDSDCALAESLRIHKTVGVVAVTLPVAVLWLRVGGQLRADVMRAEQNETRRLDQEADARRRSAAGGRPRTTPKAQRMSLRDLAAEADPLPKVDDR